jgi:ribose transport system permease protein
MKEKITNNTSMQTEIHTNIFGNVFRRIKSFREATILLTIIIFSAVLSFIAPNFFTMDNLRTTAIGMSADGIIAIGMTVALVSGGFDLSVGSIMGVSSVIAGVLYLAGVNIWIGCLISVIIGLLFGLFDGLLIGKVGINPFITTLGMMGIARGVAYVVTTGSPQSLASVPETFSFLGRGNVFGLPIIVLVFIVLAVAGDFLMRKSSPFRKVFYIGSNEKAAVLSGINVCKVKIGVYMLTAFLSSIAGLLTLSRFGVATPTAGEGTELRVISAAVIGGASLSGGEGTILGAVLGIILLNLINNALVLLKVSVYWQALISGFILIAAVTIDHMSHRKKAVKVISK